MAAATPSAPRMTAPATAPPLPYAIQPMIRPASSQTTRNPMITMMLFRLLRVIWWYMSGRPGAPHRVAHPVGEITAPDLSPDQAVAERRHVLRMVLVVVGPHRARALVRHLAPPLAWRGLLVAVRDRGRQVEHLPAAELEPVAEVEVLARIEVARIEEAHAVERRRADHQARARARVHLVRLGLGDVAHVVAAEA